MVKMRGDQLLMTDEERWRASIDQIYTYGNSQYPEWRVVAVKSIRKLLFNLEEFYGDMLPDLEYEGSQVDIVHGQIRSGWFYEAISQAEQAIEDLFSTMMNLENLSYFAKNVVQYNATKVKKYIWKFDVEDLEYICGQFRVPYFPLDEVWEKEKVFDSYKEAVLRTQGYLKELKEFHRKYYVDYCQYKHGLAVALSPAENPIMKGDAERINSILKKPEKCGLWTFHQGTVGDYEKRTGSLPALGIILKQDMQAHVRELHDEGNLLYHTIHLADIDEIVSITEKACILLNVLWKNIIGVCMEKDTDDFREVAFPSETLKRYFVIGFPRD